MTGGNATIPAKFPGLCFRLRELKTFAYGALQHGTRDSVNSKSERSNSVFIRHAYNAMLECRAVFLDLIAIATVRLCRRTGHEYASNKLDRLLFWHFFE